MAWEKDSKEMGKEMKHEEVKQLVREWMAWQRFNCITDNLKDWGIKRVNADDVFVKRDHLVRGKPINPRSAIVMEYKTSGGSYMSSLQGAGQVLYYSTEMDIDLMCLALPESHYLRFRRTLARLDWLNILTFDPQGSIIPQRFPFPLTSPLTNPGMRDWREKQLGGLDEEEVNKESVDIVSRLMGEG